MNLSISIIGQGRVGTVLGVLAARAGIEVCAVGGRSLERAKECAERIGADTRYCSIEEVAQSGGLILLTVSDDAIQPLAEELATKSLFPASSVLAHCSGCLSSDILNQAKQRCGCAIASFHPLLPFSDIESGLSNLPGGYFFIEGDNKAEQLLATFAQKISCHPVLLSKERKSLYHAAAVYSFCYLTTVIGTSLKLAADAGVSEQLFSKAIMHGVSAMVNNIAKQGPGAALTGPFVRGDSALIGKQLTELEAINQNQAALYRHLAQEAINLALSSNRISKEQAAKMQAVLFSSDSASATLLKSR